MTSSPKEEQKAISPEPLLTEMASSPKTDSTADSNKDKEEELAPDAGGVSRLIKEYGEGTTLYAILGFIGSIVNGGGMPVFFLYFGRVFDIGTDPDTDYKSEGLELLVAFLVIGFAFLISNALQYVCWGIYGAKISVKAREQYFTNLLRQDVGYYDEKNSGAINTELISDCSYIAGMGTAIGLFIQHTCTFVGCFALAF